MLGERDARILDKTADTDEPVIVFRAQDRYSVEVLEHYLYTISVDETVDPGVDEAFKQVVSNTIDQFREWQENNVEKVKVPDL